MGQVKEKESGGCGSEEAGDVGIGELVNTFEVPSLAN